MYNLTNVSNSQNLLDLAIASNQLTNNVLFLFITIAMFIVLTLLLVNRGILAAISTSSFITGITGILLILSGLISETFLVYYVVVMALAIAAAFVAGKGE